MLVAKPKICTGCGIEKPIWKKEGRQRFCKDCWSCHSSKNKIKPTQKKPLSPKSSKKEKLDAAYAVLRQSYLKNHPMCEARLPGCNLSASDIHHKHGRVGDLYLDDTEYIALCRNCHRWIHDNPAKAKDLNLYH
jgi:hypothetical protein